MTTIPRRLLLSGLAALAVAACTAAGGGGLASGSPAASPPASTSPGGAGSEPDPGTGGTISPPASGEPVAPAPVPTIVVPKPGRLDVHPVGATAIEARADGRHVIVKLTWWSGVEPCSVLDSVGVEKAGNHITLTIREGADRRDVACIDIAMLKATVVDLGELEPGRYTISAGANASPVQVVVS
jgi:ABC-type transport system substrate-binding protein